MDLDKILENLTKTTTQLDKLVGRNDEIMAKNTTDIELLRERNEYLSYETSEAMAAISKIHQIIVGEE